MTAGEDVTGSFAHIPNKNDAMNFEAPSAFLLLPLVYWGSLAVWVPRTGWKVDIMHRLRNRGEFMGWSPARPSTRRPRLFSLSVDHAASQTWREEGHGAINR